MGVTPTAASAAGSPYTIILGPRWGDEVEATAALPVLAPRPPLQEGEDQPGEDAGDRKARPVVTLLEELALATCEQRSRRMSTFLGDLEALGADRSELLQHHDAYGNGVLHVYVQDFPDGIDWLCIVEALATLIDRGCQTNAQNHFGETPLMLAVRAAAMHGDGPSQVGAVNVVRRLLLARADPNSSDNDGETSLMEAACAGNEALCQALLESRADAGLVGAAGQTAVDFAASSPSIVRLLTSAPLLSESAAGRAAVQLGASSDEAANAPVSKPPPDAIAGVLLTPADFAGPPLHRSASAAEVQVESPCPRVAGNAVDIDKDFNETPELECTGSEHSGGRGDLLSAPHVGAPEEGTTCVPLGISPAAGQAPSLPACTARLEPPYASAQEATAAAPSVSSTSQEADLETPPDMQRAEVAAQRIPQGEAARRATASMCEGDVSHAACLSKATDCSTLVDKSPTLLSRVQTLKKTAQDQEGIRMMGEAPVRTTSSGKGVEEGTRDVVASPMVAQSTHTPGVEQARTHQLGTTDSAVSQIGEGVGPPPEAVRIWSAMAEVAVLHNVAALLAAFGEAEAAKVDTTQLVRSRDSAGNTLLHLCCTAHPEGGDWAPAAEVVWLLHRRGCGLDDQNDFQETPLLLAVRASAVADGPGAGASEALVALLDARADPSVGDDHGETPLMEAACLGSAAACRALLRARADPCQASRSALTAVDLAAVASPQLTGLLSQQAAPEAREATATAAQAAVPEAAALGGRGAAAAQRAERKRSAHEERKARAECSWRAQAAAQAEAARAAAAAQRGTQQERRLAADGRAYTQAEFLRFWGASEGAQHWLWARPAAKAPAQPVPVPIAAHRARLLEAAVRNSGAVEAVAQVVGELEGLGEDVVPSVIRSRDSEDNGVLHLYVLALSPNTDEAQAAEIMRKLLAYKAENDRNALGETPLLLAARNGSSSAGVKAARVLLEAGASPNTADCQGDTPLVEAFCAKGLDLCAILISSRANPLHKCTLGFTAVDFASGDRDLLQLLSGQPQEAANMERRSLPDAGATFAEATPSLYPCWTAPCKASAAGLC